MQCLLINHKNLDLNCQDGGSALSLLAKNYNEECLKLLLSRNDIDINFVDEQQRCALLNAAIHKNRQMVNILLFDIRLDLGCILFAKTRDLKRARSTLRPGLKWARDSVKVELCKVWGRSLPSEIIIEILDYLFYVWS